MVHLCPGEGLLLCDLFGGSVSPACVGVGCFMRMGLDTCHEFDVVEKLCVEVLCLFFCRGSACSVSRGVYYQLLRVVVVCVCGLVYGWTVALIGGGGRFSMPVVSCVGKLCLRCLW